MAQQIKLKRSAVAGRIPTTSSLDLGEIAINTADGKLFFQRGDSTIQSFFTTNALITGSLQQSGSDSYFLSNVGIGKDNPFYTLDVEGGARFQTTAGGGGDGVIQLGVVGNNGYSRFTMGKVNSPTEFQLYNAGDWRLGSSTNSDFSLYTSGSERVRIKNNGNVGIGYTTPATTLDVATNVNGFDYQIQARNSYSGGGAVASIAFTPSSSPISNSWGYVGVLRDAADSDNAKLVFGVKTLGGATLSDEKMRITNTGNVGIGTTTPSSKLHVSGGADVMLIEGSGSTANTSIFAIDGNNGRLFEVSDDLSDSLFSVNTIAGLPVVEVFSDNRVIMGAFNQNDLVISGSKVGIGTATPAEKLTVQGNLSASGDLYLDGAIFDINDTSGSLGQVLTSVAGGTAWEDVSTAVLDEVENIYARVKNLSGGTLYKGTPVHAVSGSSSGQVNPVIAASASDASTMPATFILNEDILDEAEGQAIIAGHIEGVNTSAFNVGDVVYVGESGGYTNVKPTGSANLIQNLGVVTKVHASNGSGVIYGSGRSNDVPNLPVGKIWVGSDTYSITSSLVHLDEANGRLGIGTDSPAYALHINRPDPYIQIQDTSAPTRGDMSAGILMKDATGAQSFQLTQTNSVDVLMRANAGDLLFGTFAGTVMKLDGNNVGIGTTSPSAKLHIYEAGTTAGFLLESSGSSASRDVFKVNALGPNSDNTRLFQVQTNGTSVFETRGNGLTVFGGNYVDRVTSNPQVSVIGTRNVTLGLRNDVGYNSNNPRTILELYTDSNESVATFDDHGRLVLQRRGNSAPADGNNDRLLVSGSARFTEGLTVSGSLTASFDSTSDQFVHIRNEYVSESFLGGNVGIEFGYGNFGSTRLVSEKTNDFTPDTFSSDSQFKVQQYFNGSYLDILTAKQRGGINVNVYTDNQSAARFTRTTSNSSQTPLLYLSSNDGSAFDSYLTLNATSDSNATIDFDDQGIFRLRSTVGSGKAIGASGTKDNITILPSTDTIVIGDNLITSGSAEVRGGLTVTGSINHDGDLTVTGTVTAQEFKTEFVSASIIYRSGSTKFGDTLDDQHSFTGSVEITGSLTLDTYATNTGDYDLTIRNRYVGQNQTLRFRASPDNSVFGPNIIASKHLELASGGSRDIYLSPASSKLMTLTATGNVGIGTTTPSHPLHVSNGSDTLLVTRDVGTAVRVGIGTANPSYAIDLGTYSDNAIGGIKYLRFYDGNDRITANGNGRITLNASRGYFFYPTGSTPSYDNWGVEFRHLRDSATNTNDNILLVEQSDGTDVFNVKSSGNIGIGTASPTAKTHIVGDTTLSSDTSLLVEGSTGSDLLKVNNDGTITIAPYRQLQTSSGNAITIQGTTHQQFKAWTLGFRWVTQNGTLMELTNDGKLSIGTTTPNYKLDVSGSGNFTGGLTVTGSLTVSGSSTFTNIGPAVLSGSLGVAGNVTLSTGGYIYGDTTDPYIRLNDAAGAYLGYGTSYIGVGGPTTIVDQGTTVIRFRNNRIVATKNTLIGTSTIDETPSARLQVRGSGIAGNTIALQVENSNASASLLVRDDNSVDFYNEGLRKARIFHSGSDAVMQINNGPNYGLLIKGTGNTPYIGAISTGTLRFAPMNFNGDITGNTLMSLGFGNSSVTISGDLSAKAIRTQFSSSFEVGYFNGGDNGILWKNSGYGKFSAGIRAVDTQNYSRMGLAFYTGDNADTTTDAQERMRITRTGNIGFGTSTFNNSIGFAVYKSYSAFENGTDHLTLRPGTGLYYSSDLKFINQSYANRGSTSGDALRMTLTADGAVSASRFYTSINDTSGNIRASYDSLFTNNENETSFRSRMRAFSTNPIRNNYHFQATSGSTDTNVFYVKDTGKTYIKEDLTVENGVTVTGSLNVLGDITHDGDLTVSGTVTAQEFKTEFVSASIIYRSGSTKFGDTSDDTHSFTGSIEATGQIDANYFYGTAGGWFRGSQFLEAGNVHTLRVGYGSSGQFQLQTGNGAYDVLRATNTGLVGIGTTSPQRSLHLSGSYLQDISIVDGSIFQISSSAAGALQPIFDIRTVANGRTEYDFNVWKSSTSKFQILADNTITLQQIGGSGGVNLKGNLKTSLSTNYGGELTLHRYGALSLNNDDAYDHIPSASLYVNRGLYNNSTDYLFLLANQGADKMAVDLDGNVGIGTTTPSYKLHVSSSNNNDGIAVHYPANNSTVFPFYVGSADSGIYARLNATNFEFKRNGAASTIKTVGSNNDLALQSVNDVVFNTNGANERMRIDSTGAVQLTQYGSGTNTGTTAYRLAVDSSGNIIEEGLGAGAVDGAGSANAVTFWTDSDTVSGSGDFTWDGSTLSITGTLEASEKSFVIPHPTKEGKKLVYGVLEGPEHGVYCRGKINTNVIELPEEWTGLVDEESITVQLTSIGSHQNLYVTDIRDNKVFIKNGNTFSSKINAFYYIQGTRKDVKPLVTERDA